MTAIDETAWMDRAACKGATAVMFPGAHEPDLTAQALALCHGCPVLDDCRRWVSHPDQWEEWVGPGIWAGMPWSQRREHGKAGAARVHAGGPTAPPGSRSAGACADQVGSLGGVTRHRRAGEKPCRACADVYNGHRRGRRSARAQEAVA